jgi:hypothetical protein
MTLNRRAALGLSALAATARPVPALTTVGPQRAAIWPQLTLVWAARHGWIGQT